MDEVETNKTEKIARFTFSDGILLFIGLIFIAISTLSLFGSLSLRAVSGGNFGLRFEIYQLIILTPIWLSGLYLIYIKIKKFVAMLRKEPVKFDTIQRLTTWKTKLSAGLLWIFPLPYIWLGVYNLLYMTVWNQPGYQMGEQFAIIWVVVGIFAILLFLAVMLTLLQKSGVSYFLVMAISVYYVFTSIGELGIYASEFTKYKQFVIQNTIFFVVATAIIALLFLDRNTFFPKKIT